MATAPALRNSNLNNNVDPESDEGKQFAAQELTRKLESFNTSFSNNLKLRDPQELLTKRIALPYLAEMQVATNALMLGVHRTISSPDSQFHEQLLIESRGIKFPGINIGDFDIDYQVGGRQLGAIAAFGASNFGAIPQNQVAKIKFDDANGQDNIAKLKMLFKPDGGMNASFVVYAETKDGVELGDLNLQHPRNKIIANNRMVADYYTARAASQELRIKTGLAPDDILRNLDTGKPEDFFQGDKFYAKVPEAHPYHNLTPYKDVEDKFINELFADNYKKQIRSDYGSKLIAAAESGADLDSVGFVNGGDAVGKTVRRIGLLFEDPQEGRSFVSDDHRSINMHRTTDRSATEIYEFLTNDDSIVSSIVHADNDLSLADPVDVLAQARASDLNPDNIRFQNIRVNANNFDPMHADYGQHKKGSLLLEVSSANFELESTKNVDTVVIAQGEGNRAVAENLFGKSSEQLLGSQILLTSTDHLNGFTSADKGSISEVKQLNARLRGLYKQVINDRNDPDVISNGPENTKPTIFLVDAITKLTLDQNQVAMDELSKINVAFLTPPVGIATWAEFDRSSTAKEKNDHFIESLESHSAYRSALLSTNSKDFIDQSPKSKIPDVLEQSLKTFLANELLTEQRKIVMASNSASVEDKIKIFEDNNDLIMGVLQSKAAKNTLAAMMSFAGNELATSDYKPAYDALNRDLGVDNGSDRAANAAVISLVGKVLLDGYMRKHNADYINDPSNEKFSADKEKAAKLIGNTILSSEDVSENHRQLIADKVHGLVANFARSNPSVDPMHTDRLLKIIELGANRLRGGVLLGTPGVPSANQNSENANKPENLRPDVSDLAKHMTEFSLESIKGYSYFANAKDPTTSDTALGLGSSMAAMALFGDNEVKVPEAVVATPVVAEAVVATSVVAEAAPVEFISIPLEVQIASSIKNTAQFRTFVADTMSGNDVKLKKETLIDSIPDLQHYNPVDQKDKGKNRFPTLDPETLTELGSAQPESAASKLNLVYTFSSNSRNSFTGTDHDADQIELYAADYASRDDMMLSLIALDLDQTGDMNKIGFKLESVESEALDENIAKLFNDKLGDYFSIVEKDPSDSTKKSVLPAFDVDVHSMTVAEILATKGAEPELIAETVKLTEPDATTYSIIKDGNVETFTLDGKASPAFVEPAPTTKPNQAPDIELASVAATTTQPDEKASTNNNADPLSNVKGSAIFGAFMEGLVKNQIESDNSLYSSQLLDTTKTLAKSLPELALVDKADFSQANPDSMVAQLGIQSSIYQRHGKIQKTGVDMTKFESLDDAVVSYMADNLEYLSSQATVKLAVGKLETSSKDPEVQEMVKLMSDRGMKVVHPDMFTMTVPEFARNQWPDQINGKQFDRYRDEPESTVVSQTGLTIIVENDKGSAREYDLSKFETPEALAAQQKMDFRNNESGIKVVDVRCHALAKDAIATIFDASSKSMDSYPQPLPAELWAQDVKSYLSNPNVIESGKISPEQVDRLSAQADAAHKANLAGNPEPKFDDANKEQKKEQEKSVTRELDSFDATIGM